MFFQCASPKIWLCARPALGGYPDPLSDGKSPKRSQGGAGLFGEGWWMTDDPAVSIFKGLHVHIYMYFFYININTNSSIYNIYLHNMYIPIFMNIQAPLNHLSYGRIHFHQGGQQKPQDLLVLSSTSPGESWWYPWLSWFPWLRPFFGQSRATLRIGLRWDEILWPVLKEKREGKIGSKGRLKV